MTPRSSDTRSFFGPRAACGRRVGAAEAWPLPMEQRAQRSRSGMHFPVAGDEWSLGAAERWRSLHPATLMEGGNVRTLMDSDVLERVQVAPLRPTSMPSLVISSRKASYCSGSSSCTPLVYSSSAVTSLRSSPRRRTERFSTSYCSSDTWGGGREEERGDQARSQRSKRQQRGCEGAVRSGAPVDSLCDLRFVLFRSCCGRWTALDACAWPHHPPLGPLSRSLRLPRGVPPAAHARTR
jgi:hypothetical protein